MTEASEPDRDLERVAGAWRVLLEDSDQLRDEEQAGSTAKGARDRNAPASERVAGALPKNVHEGLLFELDEENADQRDDS